MDSSRFGSSGNLSQASSQLSETGQESAVGSEVEESYHSFHSAGCRPSRNGHHPPNGHTSWGEGEGLKSAHDNGKGITSTKKEVVFQLDKTPNKSLKRYMCIVVAYEGLQCTFGLYSLTMFLLSTLRADGSALLFSPSRVRWLKAINKVRVQLKEVH